MNRNTNKNKTKTRRQTTQVRAPVVAKNRKNQPARSAPRARPPVRGPRSFAISAKETRPNRPTSWREFTQAGLRATSSGISKCAQDYYKALKNPFVLNTYPCIPDMIATPSYKFSTSQAVTMTVGENKVGFAVLCPWAMASKDGITPTEARYGPPVNTAGVYITTAVYAPGVNNDFPIWKPDGDADADGVQPLYPANAPFTDAQWTQGEKSYRPVGCALRVTPTGQLSQRAGTVSLVRFDKGVFPATGGDGRSFNSTDFLNRNDTITLGVSNGPYVVSWYPKSMDYTQYYLGGETPSAPAYRNSGGRTASPAGVGVYILGAAPGDTYLVQAISYFEATADGVPVTESHSDPSGFAAAIAALTSEPPDAYGILTPQQMRKSLVLQSN